MRRDFAQNYGIRKNPYAYELGSSAGAPQETSAKRRGTLLARRTSDVAIGVHRKNGTPAGRHRGDSNVMKFKTLFAAGAALMISTGLATVASAQEKVLRIGMTAADIPRTNGQPDQGFEGNRFTGIPMFDGLTNWDLSSADKASVVVPGLATEWSVNAADKTKWTFKLRPGVKFQDGSPFNADAVVWNVEKVLKKDAPHFAADQVGVTVSRMPTLSGARKIDDLTVELSTSEPDSFLPINLTNLFMASPAHWNAKLAAVPASVTDPVERGKQAWLAFAGDPSGTGPFKGVRLMPRERFEMVANKAYWDPKRVPKIDRVVLQPLPDANARTAALLSGQVDWIEAPAPDVLPQIRQRGFTLYTNQQPHVWPWQLSFAEGSPWLDKRVRHAANLCINREELKTLLNGLMAAPKGTVTPDHPWWGNPTFDIKYDPAAAKKLMTEAGFSAAKPVKVKVQTSASGSGQMQPIPMNEYVQQALKECFFDVELDVIEWNTLFTNWRKGAKRARRSRHQCELRVDGSVLRHGALHLDEDLPARVEQLGPFRQCRIRSPDRNGPHDLRRRGTRQGAGGSAQAHRRGSALRLDRA
jgi:ABC-type transport system substrate-binding protein